MKVNVFAYRGVIGILASPECEGIVAHPGNGNLGVVCDADKVEISSEAIELLKTIPKGSDSLGSIDIFGDSNGKVVFAWLGGYMRAILPEKEVASRDYDPSLLKATENVEVPQTFKDFVDDNLS